MRRSTHSGNLTKKRVSAGAERRTCVAELWRVRDCSSALARCSQRQLGPGNQPSYQSPLMHSSHLLDSVMKRGGERGSTQSTSILFARIVRTWVIARSCASELRHVPKSAAWGVVQSSKCDVRIFVRCRASAPSGAALRALDDESKRWSPIQRSKLFRDQGHRDSQKLPAMADKVP